MFTLQKDKKHLEGNFGGLKTLEKKIIETYKLKLKKYEGKIDDLTLQQRGVLYKELLKEAVIETGLERLTKEYKDYQKTLQAEKGV